MSKTTLTELIRDSLQTQLVLSKVDPNTHPKSIDVWIEAFRLTDNALEERLNEIIEAKVNQMLNRQ